MKTQKVILIFAYMLVKSIFLYAQPVIKIADKCFGGTGAEIYVKIAGYSDSMLVIAGNSISAPSGNKTDANCMGSDLWAVMVDTALNIKWDKTYGGNRNEGSYRVFTIDNGTIVMCARSSSDSSCEKSQNYYGFPNSSPAYDYWVCAIDSNGNKLWDRTYGTTGIESDPVIEKLSDGNFIIVGTADSIVNGDRTAAGFGANDYWAIKISPSGTKLWDRVYGGTGAEGNSHLNILPDENGSFILSGATKSYVSGNITIPPLGSTDTWILKIDIGGNIVWQKRYGGVVTSSGTDYVWLENIVSTQDQGYIFLASINSQQGNSISQPSIGLSDAWVVKLDSMGNKQWDMRYGGTAGDDGGYIGLAPDGGYYVCVSTQSGVGFDITEPSFGGWDYWFFKIDSVGNKLWDKRYGGPGNDFITNLIVMPDSSIYLCGYAGSGTSTTKTDAGYGLSDYWVVRVKENFAFTNTTNLNTNFASITLYPNPTQNQIQITSPVTMYDITVQSIDGKGLQMTQINNKTANINTTALAAGVYVAVVTTKQGKVFKRFVKQGW